MNEEREDILDDPWVFAMAFWGIGLGVPGLLILISELFR